MGEKKKPSKEVDIEIIDNYCKGCAICVEYCPQDVLYMVKGLVRVFNLEACTACMLCELHCPDFAIIIHEKEKVTESE